MGFRKFEDDVSTAIQKAAGGGIAGVRSITTGDSDGEVVIRYHHESLPTEIRIQALAQDIGEYPDGNMFMLWTDDPNPPPPVAAAIRTAQEYMLGMSVYEMVTELARRFEKEIDLVLDGEVESPGEFAEEDEVDDYDAAFDTDYPSDGDEFGLPSLPPQRPHQNSTSSHHQQQLLSRIRRDLQQVREAGYKVGFVDGFGKDTTTGIVTVSIRIDKLALSNEAMEAWDVQPTEYVVLLLRFESQYTPLEEVLKRAAAHTNVMFRIGKCSSPKPSLSQALRAFESSNRSFVIKGSEVGEAQEWTGDGAIFEKLLVSNSLDSFMCESFVSLLKIREAQGCDWEDANDFLLSRIGFVADECREPAPEPVASPGNTARDLEPVQVLAADHLLQKDSTGERSFPLIAIEFAIRYFVRCTEYCLRCHRRVENGFGTLRPYVCSDPLCLFQYMAMGFGPSIEHEILTEPYVVDLLVSLCYAAIQPVFHSRGPASPSTPGPGFRIRSFPVGLRLQVPDLNNPMARILKARISASGKQIVFEDEGARNLGDRPLPGMWVAFRDPGTNLINHARIQEVYGFPKTAVIEVMGKSAAPWVISLYSLRWDMNQTWPSPPTGREMPRSLTEPGMVDIYLYNTDFDSMDDASKAAAMRHVLDTLPPILKIEEWLAGHPHRSFRTMERISPAAASLLQWIVSSNRSCILQVDRSRAIARGRDRTFGTGSQNHEVENTGIREAAEVAGRRKKREHERILGMDGWVQFRFAQGSPDKELRFNRALQEVAARKPIHPNPTIFAWHGSNLANWHSILRTGLDFKDVLCGRAFGNGVYFSPRQETSMGYASAGQSWPNSDLNITSCMSLNEIINAPEEFVSRSPHYVVSQPDWHQCRYLFVLTAAGRTQQQPIRNQENGVSANTASQAQAAQGTSDSESDLTTSGQMFYPQAQGLEVYGRDHQPLQIPLCTIPSRTIGPTSVMSSGSAKRTVQVLEESDDEDPEDVARLFLDSENSGVYIPPRKKPTSRAPSVDMARVQDVLTIHNSGGDPPTPASSSVERGLIDFEPGGLDFSTLPRLQPPSFATDAATRSLGRELKHLQALQSKTPLHELGWYIDFNKVNNLYQWIVELHSFDESLPLAQDMKLAQIGSVVLELRFGPDFPFSPPFVRVVRPRFLPFMNGGGGHVTAGGAMCMELLTGSGWSPANSMESVLLQVRMALCNVEPRPARLEPRLLLRTAVSTTSDQGNSWDYGVSEAIEAFEKAAKAHGWTVPQGLKVTAMGV
ncbi:hypothetical protein P885DRAFT_39439 [Corynascus similis CBS 632.67]